MSDVRSFALGLAAALALAACSGRHEAAQAAAEPPPPPQKTVFDDQLKTLDRAKAVQQTVDQQDAKTRKAVDEQEQ